MGEAPPSPVGPISAVEAAEYPEPPLIPHHPAVQVVRFNQRQLEFVFWARRRYGETFRMRTALPGGPVVTSHPDHVRSLFTADPDLTETLMHESSGIRPVIGPDTVLTAVGPRHMRQRKLLLSYFRGETIARYTQAIADAVEKEIDSWPVGQPFALAPRLREITLNVIMAGVFGIEGRPRPGTSEYWLRSATKRFVAGSMSPLAQLGKLLNLTREEPIAPMRFALSVLDIPIYAVIEQRRRAANLEANGDILSLLLQANAENGEMTDRDIRNELLMLVLAGHETTAYTLAWTWERLVRTPDAYERLREAVRSDEDATETIEAAIFESMRSRTVAPLIGRRVKAPWRLGPYAVEAGTPVVMSSLLLHHREDLYPRPFEFRPERWIGRKPSNYEWIPFGGGIRRCIGVALTMAEQRVAMEAMVRRLDIEAAEPEPEHAIHRNVLMIPSAGARIVIRSRRD